MEAKKKEKHVTFIVDDHDKYNYHLWNNSY